jgi:hypothetical protein
MGIFQEQNPDGSLNFEDESTSRSMLNLNPRFGPTFGHEAYVYYFDDFLGDVIRDEYSGAAGSDGAASITLTAGGTGGICTLASGAAGAASFAADATVLTTGLNFKANQGGLFVEARLRMNTALVNQYFNFGFTDVLATTTLEMPMSISGTTITTTASDAICMLYDSALSNQRIHIQGVKANVDTAINNTGFIPVADTFMTLRIELDTSGNAQSFINGVSYGYTANAVTATTALTPVIGVMTRNAASRSVGVDYLMFGQRR